MKGLVYRAMRRLTTRSPAGTHCLPPPRIIVLISWATCTRSPYLCDKVVFTCGHIICLVTKWLTCSVFASIFNSFNRSCVLVCLKANCDVYGQKACGLNAECLLLWAVTAIRPRRNCKKLSLPQNSLNRKKKKLFYHKRKIEFCIIWYTFKTLHINLSKIILGYNVMKKLNILCRINRCCYNRWV